MKIGSHHVTRVEYLQDLARYEDQKNRTISIRIALFNAGTPPANDIDVFLHFPDGFTLLRKDALPRRPKPPMPPRKPLGLMDMMRHVDISPEPPLLLPPSPHLPVAPRNISAATIRKTNSYDVSYRVRKLKQHMNAPCDRLFACFDKVEEMKSFEIGYCVNAANVPVEINGSLNIVIEL